MIIQCGSNNICNLVKNEFITNEFVFIICDTYDTMDKHLESLPSATRSSLRRLRQVQMEQLQINLQLEQLQTDQRQLQIQMEQLQLENNELALLTPPPDNVFLFPEDFPNDDFLLPPSF